MFFLFSACCHKPSLGFYPASWFYLATHHHYYPVSAYRYVLLGSYSWHFLGEVCHYVLRSSPNCERITFHIFFCHFFCLQGKHLSLLNKLLPSLARVWPLMSPDPCPLPSCLRLLGNHLNLLNKLPPSLSRILLHPTRSSDP